MSEDPGSILCRATFFFPPLFFPSLSLSPGRSSVPGRGHFFSYHFFFFPSFSPLFLSYSNFFLTLSPCLPSFFHSPILFPLLLFILILFFLYFFFFVSFFPLFFLPLSVAFLFSLSSIIILLIASSFSPPLSFPCLCSFSSRPSIIFSFSYLFHLLAKGAAINKDKAEQSKRLVVSTYYKYFPHLLALPPDPPSIIHSKNPGKHCLMITQWSLH